MLHRRQILGVASLAGLVTLWLTIALYVASAQDRLRASEWPATTEAERLPAETLMTADMRVPQWEANSIIAAVLCFAVGFGACLLVVYFLLPSLVHAQCVEIVREYLEHSRRESDIRVVVLDREGHQPRQRPRRTTAPANESAIESSYDRQHHLRVDNPNVAATPVQNPPSDHHRETAPGSMLAQIYEQNLHLRDQMRKQNRGIQQ